MTPSVVIPWLVNTSCRRTGKLPLSRRCCPVFPHVVPMNFHAQSVLIMDIILWVIDLRTTLCVGGIESDTRLGDKKGERT